MFAGPPQLLSSLWECWGLCATAPKYNSPLCRLEFKDIKVAAEAGFHPCGFCALLLKEGRADD